MIEIDASLVVPMVERLLKSADGKLRGHAVEAMFRRPTPRHIVRLAEVLDDPHPQVRVQARRHLLELSRGKTWLEAVIAEGSRMLEGSQWRALEQAAILLVQIDHKPAAQRLVRLLGFARPEVSITAAWGLRKLAVAETLAAVAAYAEVGLKEIIQLSQESISERMTTLDHQLSQLNQFLGLAKHRPADALLRRFIPKGQPVPEARAAAIWALGLIHEGKLDRELATALETRLNDITALPPEAEQVRWMSALTLGRLGAKQALDSLHGNHLRFAGSPVGNACAWAIEQISGEKIPMPRERIVQDTGWFLVPFSDKDAPRLGD
jgi:HEAT repeat protein